MLAQNGYKDFKELDRKACEKILTSTNNAELIDELVKDGIGHEFYMTWIRGKKVDSDEFMRWQFVEGQGNKGIDFIETKFKDFSIIEHYGNSWRLKVSRDSFSIGFLFGMMEEIQNEYDISEYSVAQTTLEQIFNNFALEAESVRGVERKSSLSRKKSKASRLGSMKNE
jgi:hypothetical protein